MTSSLLQARVLTDELVRNGLRHAVVCAGWRNAPLSVALLEAERENRLELHVRLDERSAGYLAMGLAATGDGLTALACTSGTAVANIYPAVLESCYSDIGFLVMTADRPPELQNTGSSQTIRQSGLFQGSASSMDVPVAENRPGQNSLWRSMVCRAVAQVDSPRMVHMNVPLREPLLADREKDVPPDYRGRPSGEPWTSVVQWPARQDGGQEFRAALPKRTIVVLGDGPEPRIRAAARYAAEAGWPVVAEPAAAPIALREHAAVLTAGALLWGSGELPTGTTVDAGHLAPDAILAVGRNTLTPTTPPSLDGTPVHRVGDPDGWTDPEHSAVTVTGRLPEAPPRVVADSEADWDWSGAWLSLDADVRAVADRYVDSDEWPTGMQVARDMVAELPADSILFLGASNSVRDTYFGATPRSDLYVHSNRGVAGIDGNTSTAAGLALANSRDGIGRPCYALMGDLTFLYDVNGLLVGPHERRPDLTVVVLNDGGGGNFSLLPDADESDASFERLFGTPQSVDLEQICLGHAAEYTRATDRRHLVELVKSPPAGLHVIEVVLERDRIRDAHAQLREVLTEAVRARTDAGSPRGDGMPEGDET
ncbi:2-succinyl-5-enolpyruvyl-6-hydroxy-3-cyclohexene-1-carboxylic-acid synthase [Pseudonocardia phyllosphaerae]|uniref:2-succinyl-5-enolpyruvyl-6-hydroxy-3- cyclohexene-1-carboxylic-acid synthase n=1 Tax=Pseudonocardia phyllosphaerae TaxID=3390502 RepID=UPI00397AFF0E